MQQDIADLHVSIPLTIFSQSYRNVGFIADIVCPQVSVTKEIDKYFIYDFTSFLDVQTRIADGDPAGEIEWSPTQGTFACEEYGLKKKITDRQRDAADAPLNLDQDTTAIITDMILLGKEKRVSTDFTTTSNYASASWYSTPANGWDTAAGTPFADIQNAKIQVMYCTRAANAFATSYQVAVTLARHADLVDLIKYTHPDFISTSGLPNPLWGLKTIISEAQVVNVNQGQTITAANKAFIWGKNAIIFYLNPSPGRYDIAFEVAFTHLALQTSRWRIEDPEATYIKVKERRAEKIISNVAGYLYSSVIA